MLAYLEHGVGAGVKKLPDEDAVARGDCQVRVPYYGNVASNADMRCEPPGSIHVTSTRMKNRGPENKTRPDGAQEWR